MAEQAHQAASYADIEALSADLGGEMLFDSLVTHPRPAPPHGAASTSLVVENGDRLQRVCEVLSPSTANLSSGARRCKHATYAFPQMWLVDPIDRRLEPSTLQDGHWLLHEAFDGEVDVDAPPFAAVPFPLTAQWLLAPAPDAT